MGSGLGPILTQELIVDGTPGGGRARADASAQAPRLAATLYLPADAGHPLPGLLVGHGAGSRRDRHASFCRTAAAHGLAVLAFDFRGHGESEGRVDGRLDEDVVAAARALRRHPAVSGPIGYRGSSMGAYNGVLAARAARLDALALLCTADETVLSSGLDRLERGDFEEPAAMRVDVPATRRALAGHDLMAEAAKIRTPALLLHARGDDVVPIVVSLRLAGALAGPAEVLLLPGGDHSALQSDPTVHERVATWLGDTLRRVAAEGIAAEAS